MSKKDLQFPKLAEHIEKHFGHSVIVKIREPMQLICPRYRRMLEANCSTMREYEAKKRRRKALFKEDHAGKRRNWRKKRRLKVWGLLTENGERSYYTKALAAEKLKFKKTTFRSYVQFGIIPKPIFYNKFGWGAFSDIQIKLMRKVFRQVRKRKMSREEASAYLHEHWNDELHDKI